MMSLSILIFWTFVTNFVFCEFGEHVTSHFNELNNIICQAEWYSLPINIQRMIPTIMMTTKRQIIVQGFGGVALTRKSFQIVSPVSNSINQNQTHRFQIDLISYTYFQNLSRGFSYFMVFSQ